jgi:transposase
VLQQDAITVQLQLEGLVVLDVVEAVDRIDVATSYSSEVARCPRCNRATGKVYDRREQRKRDLALWEKPVCIHLWKRRFRCLHCRHVFTEEDPVCGRYKRTTRRLRAAAARHAQEASVRAVARWHGVSEGTVQRSWVESYAATMVPSKPHVFIGLDGFCVRRPGVMWTGMWDFQTRKPVAVMPGERQQDVQKLLERHLERDKVQAVVIDLHEPSRQAIHMALPRAAIVADKFHILALAQRSLQEVRGGRRLRGNNAWLMHRNVEHLTQEEADRLAEALALDETLRRAWLLKEGLRSVYRSRDKEKAGEALDGWLRDVRQSGLEPFKRTARTLTKWREEVLHYWDYPLTNAMVEGKHNRVKVLKRRAYGYRNDSTFSLRFLNCFHTD